MKILIINNLYSPNIIGGAERSIQSLAESLVKMGCHVTVISLSKKAAISTIHGVNVHYLELSNLYWPFGEEHPPPSKLFWHTLDVYNRKMAKRVGSIVEAEQPNVIHTNNLAGFSVAVWSELKRRGLPIVHTLRDFYLLCFKSSMFKNGSNCEKQCIGCRAFSYIKKTVAGRVDHVVGISRFMLVVHKQYGFFEKAGCSYIYNSYVNPLAVTKRNSSGKIRFGFIGRLVPNKGVDLLIDLFLTPEVSSFATMVIAGDGQEQYVHYLKSRVSVASVEFLGAVNPEDFYRKVDVVVVPSLWNEPLGRIIFEAYAHGIPVIASRRGGIPEIVEDGKTGFTFDPSEKSGFLSALRRFCDTPGLVSKMGEYCLEKSRDFLPEKIAKQYLHVYQQVLEKQKHC